MKQKLESINKGMIIIAAIFLLEVINITLLESSWILLITIPQFLIVLVLLFKGDYEKALLWHIIFNVTSCDKNTIDEETIMLSYSSLKLVGPLTISYILLGLIWFFTLFKKRLIPSDSLLYKLRRLFVILFAFGSVFGIIGLGLFNYSLGDFIPPFRYMLIALLYLDIFSRLYNESFMRKCYHFCIYMLIATPLATAICYFILNITYGYSVFESFVTTPIFIFTPILILYLIYHLPSGYKTQMIIALMCYFALTIAAARGSQFLTTAVVLIILVYIVYFSKNKNKYVGLGLFRTFLPIIAIGIVSVGSYLLLNIGESLTSNKLNQFVSLFTIFGNSGGGLASLEEISTSPYIRIAEVLDIIDNGLQNPFLLILGKGYGGYYTDSLNLFVGIDLANGAFGEDAISTGRFGSAHSMYPYAILFHGIIGFALIIKMGITYLKQIEYTPLLFASFVFLLYSLYYNVPLMTASLLFLFASEYRLTDYYRTQKENKKDEKR